MRLPGWLAALFGFGALAFLTTLCSVLSYSITRTAVIDAADNGVEIPSFRELVDYVVNPPDSSGVLEAFNIPSPEPDQQVADGGFQLQPTDTPDPNRIATQAVTQVTAAPTLAPNVTPLCAYNNTCGDSSSGAASLPTLAPPPAVDIPAWQDTDRINILLMGVDQRGDEINEDRFRTDTMIVVQIDPIRKTLGLLSFPRDLWVRIPGFESNKINQANYLGDSDPTLPGGGPALAMETIRENFGIRVDYYVQVNFDVFTTVVNLIAPEGVEICITETIHDDHYPDAGRGTIVVHFDPGCQRLDAERLLQYARTRATQGGDFDRNRRQQEVLKALQAEVLNVGNVGALIGAIPSIYGELANSYRTNLNLEQIVSLAGLMAEIPAERITSGAINTLHVTLGKSPDGLDILIPNYIAINQVISDTFDPQPDLSVADLRARATDENADILILNNTNISGLASRTQEWFTSQSVLVQGVGNMPEVENATNTLIYDFTGKTFTTRYLAALMGLPQSNIRAGAGSNIQSGGADVVIVLGQDAESILAGD